MVNEEINKIDEIEKRLNEEEQRGIEEDCKLMKEINTKTTIAVVKNDKETDYSKTIRHGIIDFSSYAMIDPAKRKTFGEALKADATINEYVDEQLYTKWLKTNNPHFKAGIVYSYLYLKELNKL